MRIKNKQDGIALVSAIAVAALVMIVTSVMVYRIVSNTKDITRVKKMDAAKNIADEGLENFVDWMNERNDPKNYVVAGRSYKDAQDLLISMTSDNFITPLNSVNTSINPVLNLVPYVYNSTDSVYKSITNEKTIFPLISGTDINSISLNSTGGTPIISELPNNVKIFTVKSSGKDNKIKGEYQIGMTPIAPTTPTIRFDLIKVVAVVYIPSVSDPNSLKRKYLMAIQRPRDASIQNKDAIISGGDINLGNGDSVGGASPTTLTTQEGDVHTNHKLTIGPGGYVDGDASASDTITNQGTVTGTVTPNAPEKPIPKLNYLNPFPSTACSPYTNLAGKVVITGPCTINSASIPNDDIVIINDVYVNGGFDQAGNKTIESGSSFSMLIASGTIKTAGNASSVGTNKMAFITTGGDLEVKGNGNINGLFVNDNPNGEVNVTGNGNIFGGIISQGTVKFSGNNSTVKRDTSLTNVPYVLPADAYKMRLLTSKEINY